MKNFPFRVHLAQHELLVGDIDGAMRQVLSTLNAIASKRSDGVARHTQRKAAPLVEQKNEETSYTDLVVFPELFLGGYPPRDLLIFKGYAVKVADAIKRLKLAYYEAFACNKPLPCCIVGAPVLVDSGRKIANAAFCFSANADVRIVEKTILPNYDVFYEKRYFCPAKANIEAASHKSKGLKKQSTKPSTKQSTLGKQNIVSLAGVPSFIFICEDMWVSWLLLKNAEREYWLSQARKLLASLVDDGESSKIGAIQFSAKRWSVDSQAVKAGNNRKNGKSAKSALQGERSVRTVSSLKNRITQPLTTGTNTDEVDLTEMLASDAADNIHLAINVSASPFELGKRVERVAVGLHMLGNVLKQRQDRGLLQKRFTLVFINQMGGNDELLFDGSSFVMHYQALARAEGQVFLRILNPFVETIEKIVVDDFIGMPSLELRLRSVSRQDSVYDSEKENKGLGNPEKSVSVDFEMQATNASLIETPQRALSHYSLAESLSEKDADELMLALISGIRAYARKNRFSRMLVGLSGGIDSAVTAALAMLALREDALDAAGNHGANKPMEGDFAQRLITFTMPSPYSSLGSVEDSEKLAKAMGCPLYRFPIEQLMESFFSQWKDSVKTQLQGVPAENLQARLRGIVLMTYSNANQALLLTTGNKSEVATGYCTLYGDTNGALSVLGDCYKSDVYALALAINRAWQKKSLLNVSRESNGFEKDLPPSLIPVSTFEKAPSAELAPKQKDADTLPAYEELDAILFSILQRGIAAQGLIAQGHETETVERVVALLKASEYKRKQMPPVLRIGANAFGMGRMMPLSAIKHY